MKEIQLTRGFITQVDDEDYEYLNQFNWHILVKGNNIYATTTKKNSKDIGTRLMHRWIMKNPKGMFIDHKDGNGLNNQKNNLRVCTVGQNNMNRFITWGKSRYKGPVKYKNRWAAFISLDNKNTYLGSFKEEIDAAKAYDKAAKIHHGEFANINFPENI